MKVKVLLVCLLVCFFVVCCPKGSISNPVEGATGTSFNHKTFWQPWGDHHHRGIDIFAKKGTPVHPAISGFVIWTRSNWGSGGKCILELGKDLRFHYYAHLNSIETSSGSYISSTDTIGTVGDSGNAAGKPCHLHYSICSIFKKTNSKWDDSFNMYFHDPTQELLE